MTTIQLTAQEEVNYLAGKSIIITKPRHNPYAHVTEWEPEVGVYCITPKGPVNLSKAKIPNEYNTFGIMRKSEIAAYTDGKKMQSYNRLLAYKAEFAPDYEPSWTNFHTVADIDPLTTTRNYHIYFDSWYDRYEVGSTYAPNINTVYFPQDVAQILVDKLNSGEVTL